MSEIEHTQGLSGEAHIIAIATYGSHRVKHPHSGQTISAYKLGYTSAVMPVLLALYGANARDVSPKQASYRYLQIDGEVVVRHGHILLTLTPDELARIEAITRQHHRAAVYLWRDDQWWAFPDNTHADYTEPGYRVGPTFNPMGLRPPSPTTGERANAISGITIERSQREAGGAVWWWINGDTYPHRELLKRHGARFSGKRKAWYWIGAELPAAIQALAASDAESDTVAPDEQPETPLLTIFGGQISGTERAANGDLIVKGANGIFATRTTWIDRNDRPETVWEFDLPPQERVGNPLPAMQQALQANHAIYSLYTRKWHFAQPDKVAALDALVNAVPSSGDPAMSPELAALIEQALADDDATVVTPEAEPAPAIRISKPAPLPADGEALDAVQTAIRSVKTQPIAAVSGAALSNGRITPIAQSYVGELTGSITGQVFCYGWAVHEGICIYLNMAGPRGAVEAIRAKLSKGDIVSVVPEDAPSVELTAGEGNSGMYHPYLHYLPEARFASLILVHDWAVTPNYGGKAITFIFRTSDTQAVAKLRHHVMQLVNIPVFDVWSAYLYEAGQKAMLVRKTRAAGGIDLLSVDLDATAWTRLITGGLEQKIIPFP